MYEPEFGQALYDEVYHSIVSLMKLTDEDATDANIEICNSIVKYIRARLVPLSHKNLVKYVHANYNPDMKSRSL